MEPTLTKPFRLIVMALAALVVSGIPAIAKPLYGAMAVVPGQGHDFHGEGIETSARQARRSAMSQCANKRCKVVQEYVPGQCVHVIQGQRQVFWNEELFSAREKRFVLEHCKVEDSRCSVVVSQCLSER